MTTKRIILSLMAAGACVGGYATIASGVFPHRSRRHSSASSSSRGSSNVSFSRHRTRVRDSPLTTSSSTISA